jgi:hypothetical protein
MRLRRPRSGKRASRSEAVAPPLRARQSVCSIMWNPAIVSLVRVEAPIAPKKKGLRPQSQAFFPVEAPGTKTIKTDDSSKPFTSLTCSVGPWPNSAGLSQNPIQNPIQSFSSSAILLALGVVASFSSRCGSNNLEALAERQLPTHRITTHDQKEAGKCGLVIIMAHLALATTPHIAASTNGHVGRWDEWHVVCGQVVSPQSPMTEWRLFLLATASDLVSGASNYWRRSLSGRHTSSKRPT